MKPFMIFMIILFFLLSLALGQGTPKWCVTSSAAKTKCDGIASQLSNRFTCVLGNDEKDCYKKIVSRAVDFGVFDGRMIYQAGKDHNLSAIMAENFKNVTASSTAYYAVAVVKNGSGFTINNLGGEKSCHTGVQEESGWIVPAGALLSRDIMKWKECDQYASVATFFTESCAPGGNDKRYNPNGKYKEKLCSLCSGSGDSKCSRSSKEPFFGFDGAFKCLKDGVGDVAFTKASVLTALPIAEQSRYKLLCLDGTTKDPEDFASCSLARVPSHAVLTRNDAPISSYQNLFQSIDRQLNESSAGGLKYDGTLFSNGTIGLETIPLSRQSYEQYLDAEYIKSVAALQKCARWCTQSSTAYRDCVYITNEVNHFDCVNGNSSQDCYTKISKEEADIGLFDGSDVYHAGKNLNLIPIVAEKRSTSDDPETAYYAMAVVKANSKLTIKTLKAKKSCHTGVQKRAGWIMPVGFFLSQKMMLMPPDCDQYGAVANFFSASCAPGANEPKYNSKMTCSRELCSLCAGIGSNKCSRSSSEPYYSHAGALKCLTDGKGDVAFFKNGYIPKTQESQYMLLCRNGTSAEPRFYKTCNLARVPSHAMLARPGAPVEIYQEILAVAQKKMGRRLLSTIIFSKEAEALLNITKNKQTYNAYLDTAFMENTAAWGHCNASNPGPNASYPTCHAPIPTSQPKSSASSLRLFYIVLVFSLFVSMFDSLKRSIVGQSSCCGPINSK